jgi:hypothetical protein
MQKVSDIDAHEKSEVRQHLFVILRHRQYVVSVASNGAMTDE